MPLSTVLVAHPDAQIRVFLDQLLSGLGYRVALARDWPETLLKQLQDGPDLAFLGSGLMAAPRSFRMVFADRFPETVVVAIGADLPVPFDREAVVVALDTAVRSAG